MSGMTHETGSVKQPWVTPHLAYHGLVDEVLQGGQGKLSLAAGDPGEERCEKPNPNCRAAG